MLGNRKHVVVGVAVLAALWVSTTPAQAQETTALLRWKNGDVLPGKLLDSTHDQVRWSSPHFADDLLVDAGALESIFFRKRAVPRAEAFRVTTTSGDVWEADLVGSDDSAFLFSSKRYGLVRVKRDAVYSLNRRAHPDLVFDGSQLPAWNLSRDGVIKHMTYKVYKGVWSRTRFPDFSGLVPRAEGAIQAGWLDLQLAQMDDNFGMVFEGQLETEQEGDYTFELFSDDSSRLMLNGELILESTITKPDKGTIQLAAGSHSLRVEYLEFQGIAGLSAWWTGPDFARAPLFGTNPTSVWRHGLGGHPQTHRSKAVMFQELELPKRFEMDLEFASAESPRFVFALGKDLQQALRLETWANELVVVQDKIFEPVLTIEKNQRAVRLRLAFDADTGVLKVLDMTGRLLVKVDGIRPTAESSGLLIKNRGQNLAVRRLSVYRQPAGGVTQQVDPSRPRVYRVDGQVVHGRLFVEEGGSYVLDAEQSRHDIDLSQVDRIARPGIPLTAITDTAELTYCDGAVVRGRIEQLNPDRVTLRTAFAETPVTCALAGASALRPGPLESTGKPGEADRDADHLFLAQSHLRGQLTFHAAGSPLRWKPEGAAEPVRLTDIGGARVERSATHVSEELSLDAEEFPHVLHLKNGEVIPCQVSSYDEKALGFRSPFNSERKMDSAHVKGIDFTGETFGERRSQDPVILDEAKLRRALTVPRFNRDNPPSHILVARTGDLKRGKLLGINGQTIQFESKLRKLTVAVDRVACVVEVSKPDEDLDEGPDEPAAVAADPAGRVRATLADGSVLVFEALESRAGKLSGRSSIYGEMAIPVNGIRRLQFGHHDAAKLESAFEDWVVRPGKEPEFGSQ